MIVSGAFRVMGFVLGIPSIAASAYFAYAVMDLRSVPSPPPEHSQYLEVSKYGLVGLLNNGVKGVLDTISTPIAMAAELAIRLMEALAVLSFLAALFATFLYFVGRGIGRRATWARVIGIVFAAGLLAVSVGVLSNSRIELALYTCIPIGMSLYTLWALGWRFG